MKITKIFITYLGWRDDSAGAQAAKTGQISSREYGNKPKVGFMRNNNPTILFYLPAALKESAQIAARENGVSLSALMRSLLDGFLQVKGGAK